MNKKNLNKKIIIITGANGVLGKCLAKSLKNLSKNLKKPKFWQKIHFANMQH